MAVAHVYTKAADDDVDCFAEARITRRVRVAEYGMHGRDQGEFVEDLVAAHVTGVEDELNSGEGCVDVRTEQAVRVGYQANPDEGWGMGDGRQLLTSDRI